MITHKGSLTLTTPRLTLRPFVREDAENMHKNWVNDSRVTTYVTWQPHETFEVTQTVLRLFMDGYKDMNYYFWAIVPNFGCYAGEPIGSISVVGSNDDIGWCEVGYCVAYDYWGNGVVTECMSRVIAFLQDEVGYNRVQAKHHVDNPASGKVMQKCGMKHEGTLRDYYKDGKGNICTVEMYSILKRDRMS